MFFPHRVIVEVVLWCKSQCVFCLAYRVLLVDFVHPFVVFGTSFLIETAYIDLNSRSSDLRS